jgi:branched-chain amino acid transport system substrate-binding protein
MFVFAACSGDGGTSGEGGDKGTIEIWSSLPRQGSNKAQTDTVVNAIQLAIEEAGGTAGGYTIKYEDKDDSTAATGQWDEATEIRNSNDAANNDAVVGYLGTFNSGAAKLAIPILCEAGVVMISPANTYPGLSKAGKGEPGEPDIYHPNGCTVNSVTIIVEPSGSTSRSGVETITKISCERGTRHKNTTAIPIVALTSRWRNSIK